MVVVGEGLADLDPVGVLGRLEAARAAVAEGEFAELVLAVHWVVLHAAVDEAAARAVNRGVRRGRERFVLAGAEGTPWVAELALAEFGAVGGRSPLGARRLLADAVNVRYRHPRLWEALAAGRGRVWQAREVVGMCLRAGLDVDRVGWVDAVTTPYLGSLPWSRFEALVEAKIIEADPAAAGQRARAAAMARFVRTGRMNEHGIRSVYARAEAGDAVCFTAMVDRIAYLLAEAGDTDAVPVLRSKALGVLATPARALQMLLDAADPDHPGHHDGGDHDAGGGGAADDDPDGDPDTVGEGEVHPSQNDADEPVGMRGDPGPFTSAGAKRIAAALARVDPRRLLPQATLYVHLSRAALDGGGVARVEDLGPVTVDQVAGFLGHRNVRVVPVLDVAGQVPVDGYEVPDRMREALHLRHPACAFPFATYLGRNKDADHTVAYLPVQDGGPPGQTRLGNLAGLTRLPHRLKTHGRWRLRQPVPGVFLWRSPHGWWWRVDHLGAHALGRETSTGRAPVQQWASPIELDLTELINRGHR